MTTALQLLRRLRANYPNQGLRVPGNQRPAPETLALWREVDAYIAAQTPAPTPPGPSITSCCYCGVTQPYTTVWLDAGYGRVSCGGPDCVAF
jgi:hypothetical protein